MVTRGMDRCLVGFLPDKYLLHKNVLNGRLAQVEEIYVGSQSRHKKQYSDCHEGVCMQFLWMHQEMAIEVSRNIFLLLIVVRMKMKYKIYCSFINFLLSNTFSIYNL